MRECLWALKLMLGYACRRAGLPLGVLGSRLLPGCLQLWLAERTFAWLGPILLARRFNRLHARLRTPGVTQTEATRWTAELLARAWLRRVRRHRLISLPHAELQRHLRSMTWHDPLGLWPAAAGRRGVVCLLPSGDAELGLAAALDRPGAPAHYFVQCPHHAQSHAYRMLLALQRVGHRLDVDRDGTRGMAWRQLRRGATVFTLLTVDDVAMSAAVPGPLRLARLAGVPVLLLGHRCDGGGAGTLHVVGEYAGAALDTGSPRLLESARRFLRASPHDCHAAVA
ncbi:hypothetical protein ACNJRW_03940 [Stenotrophomonas maltophilia]